MKVQPAVGSSAKVKGSTTLFKGLASQAGIKKVAAKQGKMNGSGLHGSVTGHHQAKPNKTKVLTPETKGNHTMGAKGGQKAGNKTKAGPGEPKGAIQKAIINNAVAARGWK